MMPPTTVVDALLLPSGKTAHSYFLLMQGLLRRRGIPVARYTDRHAVFRHTPGSGLPGMPTQWDANPVQPGHGRNWGFR